MEAVARGAAEGVDASMISAVGSVGGGASLGERNPYSIAVCCWENADTLARRSYLDDEGRPISDQRDFQYDSRSDMQKYRPVAVIPILALAG